MMRKVIVDHYSDGSGARWLRQVQRRNLIWWFAMCHPLPLTRNLLHRNEKDRNRFLWESKQSRRVSLKRGQISKYATSPINCDSYMLIILQI